MAAAVRPQGVAFMAWSIGRLGPAGPGQLWVDACCSAAGMATPVANRADAAPGKVLAGESPYYIRLTR
jgi:hypothetical protein